MLPVYLARRRRKVDAADADGDDEEGEVLEADAEVQERRKTEDAVAHEKTEDNPITGIIHHFLPQIEVRSFINPL